MRVGRALALALAGDGFDVVVHRHTSEAEAREVADRIRAGGRRARVVAGDLESPDDIERVAAAAAEAFGRVDVLVNNASTFRRRPVDEITVDEWDRVAAVNTRAPFFLSRALAPALREASGSVVNLVDLSAIRPWPAYAHHSVSKAGLLHLTKVLASAWAPEIRVNAVAPGAVLLPEEYGEEEARRSRERAALGRLGDPDDVVRALRFLVDSPYVTGECVVVDGGRLLR